MRIDEALQLKLSNINLGAEPVQIQIRGEYTKTGNSRYAFTSREAKEAIEEWLKSRSKYLEGASGKSHKYGKAVEDARLFPFENSVAYMIWKNALIHAKQDDKDQSTNRHRVHPHVLRKFFRTKMATLIPVDVVEALMGHEGYLTEVYRRYSQEDLAKFYLQGESSLSIFTEAEEVSKLRVEVEERNKQLQTLVNGFATENLELKSRMARAEIEKAELEKRINNLSENVVQQKSEFEKTWSELGHVAGILTGLKPLIDNIDEIDELLAKKREEKEADRQVKQYKAEQEAKEEIRKKLDLDKVQTEITEQLRQKKQTPS